MIEKRINISSNSPWEAKVGYSRAVRVGNVVEVTGTVAEKEGAVVGKGDAYKQTQFALQKIEKVLEEAGARLTDVVRTRIFVTNIDDWEKIGQAHHGFFHEIMPCTSMIEVSRLIHPDYLVEIEATAIIQ